jgi:parallel beta-helix repeat protein
LNNEILTNVKEQAMHNVSTKELGDWQNPWKYRFHGVNGIRIHGTQDRDFLIKGNIIGTTTSGAQKGIHIHGTSLSNRDHDDDGVTDLPMQGFISDDQGLTALGPYANRSDESSMRKNFKIISNTVRGHHTAGIDFEGDQLNIEIRGNTVTNISDKYYVAAAQSTIDGGVGIKILTEVAPLNIYNLFGSGTAYSLDFVGSAKNVLIQLNTVTDTALGIYLSNTNNDLTKNFAFDNFPLNPVTPIKDNYNCSLTSMFSNCSNQVSLKNNIIRRSNHNSIVQASHPLTLALQSHCLFINGMVGVEVTNNTFDTCNVADFDYLGQPAAINVTNSKKVYFLNNPISIDATTEVQRQSLGTLTDTTRNRYFAYRFNGTANNISIISRLQTSETVLLGCSNTVDSNCLAKYNFKSSVGNIFGTQGTNYTNELQTSNPSPYMFIPSIELNNINENP